MIQSQRITFSPADGRFSPGQINDLVRAQAKSRWNWAWSVRKVLVHGDGFRSIGAFPLAEPPLQFTARFRNEATCWPMKHTGRGR